MLFHRLFTPIKINGMELKNRIIMPALHHKYTPTGHATEQLCEYYNARAKGGVGLIIVGGMRFDGYGGTQGMASLETDEFIDGYKKFTDGIHENGAKVCAQLYHSGRYARRKNIVDGNEALSASSTYNNYSRETCKEMTVKEIKTVQKQWADAAVRAKKAGFDAIEVIACTGYLICQFLSEMTNMRTDEYGGSQENRFRFGKEVIETIRTAVGADYPILIRLSGNEFMKDGEGLSLSTEFAKVMEKAGVDLINVTGGWHESKIPQLTGDVPPANYTYLADEIKQHVKIPVAASNRMGDPYVAEEVLALGKSDMICLGRVLVADPEWVNKVRDGRLDELRKCVACNQGCLANAFFQKPLDCLINGMVGREYLYKDAASCEKPKRILVVGGGPGGAEFAIRAAERGHHVTLWEKEKSTGGQLPLVAAPSGKREFLEFIKYQSDMLQKTGVHVCYEKEATAQDVIDSDFDEVILATGATAKRIPLAMGESKIPVYTANEVLAKKAIPGKNVVVIGGGSVGCEVAHVIAEEGTINPEQLYFLSVQKAESQEMIDKLLNNSLRNVHIIEMMPKIGMGFDPGAGWPILKDLKRLKVSMCPNTQIIEIGADYVVSETKSEDGNTQQERIPCDTIILAVGSASNNELYKELDGKIPQLHIIGDGKNIGKIIHAIRDAVDLAMEI